MYTLLWEPATRREAARLFAGSPDPAAVAQAVDRAEERLQRDPLGASLPLAEGLRKAVVPPLAFFIEVDRNTVRIHSVTLAPGPP